MRKAKPRKTTQDIALMNQEVYASMKACASIKGVTMKLLRTCKANNAPGFHQSGRVIWDNLGPWLTENLTEMTEKSLEENDIESLKRRKLSGEATKIELEVEKLRDNLLSKEDVKNFVQAIATAQSAILKERLIDELPVKLVGKEHDEIVFALNRVVTELIALFRKDIK